MEHRWGQRFEVSFEALLHLPASDSPRRAQVTDISASGAFIETNMVIPVLSCIRVELRFRGDGGQSPVLLPACVVRRTRKGVGVEWCEAESLVVAELVSRHAKPAALSNNSPALRLGSVETISAVGFAVMEANDLTCTRSPSL